MLVRPLAYGLNTRALLAVAALALSVAYGVTAAAVLTGVDGQGGELEAARQQTGFAVARAGFVEFARTDHPGAVFVDWVDSVSGRVATVSPWEGNASVATMGPHHADWREVKAAFPDKAIENHTLEYVPLDAVVVDPTTYGRLFPDRQELARVAFVVERPSNDGTMAVPWQGVAEYFDRGVDELSRALGVVVLATGSIAVLLSAGLIYLEVLARRQDLALIESFAGPRSVRRHVLARTVFLVVLGLAAGAVASFVVLRVAGAAAGAAFRPPLVPMLIVGVALGAGAVLAGFFAGMRALRGEADAGHARGATSRRFRGPIRFHFVTPRMFAPLFAAAFVTTAVLSVVLGTAALPGRVFGAEDPETFFVAYGEGNPLRASTPRFLAENAHQLDGVRAAVPETMAPTVWRGEALMVKGTSFDLWRSFTGASLVEGDWPEGRGQALVGGRVAERLDLHVGDSVLLPASYRKGVEWVTVVGVHGAPGIDADQLLVDLDTGAALADLPPDRVTGFRVRPFDSRMSWSELAPSSGVHVARLEVTPEAPQPFTDATAKVLAFNFGEERRARDLSLRVAGQVVDQTRVVVEPQAVRTVEMHFEVPDDAVLRVEVNPSADVRTAPAALEVDAPAFVRPGEPFEVIITRDGDPVPNAVLLLDGTPLGRADEEGRQTIVVHDPGRPVLTAGLDGDHGGTKLWVRPVEWDDVAHPVVKLLRSGVVEDVNGTHGRVQLHVSLVNLGNRTLDSTVLLAAVGADPVEILVSVDPAAEESVTVWLTLPFGLHEVRVLDAQITVSVDPASITASPGGPVESVMSVEEALEARRIGRANAPTTARQEAFVEQVFGAMEDATVLVVLITMVHGGVLAWVATLREVQERREIVRLHHDLGADADSRRLRAAREAFMAALLPILLGAGVAVVALALAAAAGFPSAFGHVLPSDGAAGVALRTGVALLLVVGIAAVTATRLAPADDALTDGGP